MGNQRFVNHFYDNPVGLLVLEIATLSLLRTQFAVGMHSKERAACAFVVCQGSPITFTATNANLYEFFVNGVSQGAPSATIT